LYEIHKVLDPADPLHAYVFEVCGDPELAAKLEFLHHIPPFQRYSTVGPAERMLRNVFRSPCFMTRCDGNFDFVSFLNRGGFILVEGGGVSEDAKVVTLGALIQLIIHAARQGRFQRRVTLVLDEAPVVVGGFEAKALAELRKSNLDIVLICQTLDQFPREFHETILMNCERFESFRCNSFDMAKQMADILGTATLNPNAVAHTRHVTRQYHAGYDELRTTNRGTRYDDVGLEIGSDARDGISYRSRYATEREAIHDYKSYGMQIQELQKQLLNLQVGERLVRDHGGVRFEKVSLPKEPYPWPGLVEKRTQQRILRSIGEHGTKPCFESLRFTPPQQNRSSTSSKTRNTRSPSTNRLQGDFLGWRSGDESNA
jgi:hypothetical protein